MYKEALLKLGNSVSFLDHASRLAQLNPFNECFNHVNSKNINSILLVTLDGNIGLSLFFWLFRISLVRPSVKIYTNLFAYHILHKLSLRAFFFFVLLVFFPGLIVFVSDPYLEARYYYPFFKKRIYYAPDFCLDREILSAANLKRIVLPFDVPNDQSLIINVMGGLNAKKLINELALCLNKIYSTQDHDIFLFVFAGSVKDSLAESTILTLEKLHRLGKIIFYPHFLDDQHFYKLLSLSYSSWCVQGSFNASSGVFTRSCHYGVPPITSTVSTLGRLCTSKQLGYTVDTGNLHDSLPHVFNQMLSQNRHLAKSMNCRRFSLCSDESRYREAFLKPFRSSFYY